MFSEKIYGSWREKQFAKYEQLDNKINLKKLFHKKKVLDIASGPCWFEEFLLSQRIDVSNFLCVDKSEKHLNEKNVDVKTLEADARNLELSEKFDAIVALDCLHLFDFYFDRYLNSSAFVLASMFFNRQNLEERRKLLRQKLKGLKIQKEINVKGDENEIFILACDL